MATFYILGVCSYVRQWTGFYVAETEPPSELWFSRTTGMVQVSELLNIISF